MATKNNEKTKKSDPLSPFAFVKSVTQTKENLMRDTENDALAEKAYTGFIVNRALALYCDTVLYANEMNMRSHLDSKLQYEYYLNIIRKSARYEKWIKTEGSDDLEAVKQFYGFSNEKAKQALTVLTADQLMTIKKKLDTGGR